mmetsp:Transcript_33170/g.65686  ORF Transcript_33170/g.65686 Transcript_33170/m.65686 type:complete len:546 (-) Transcript_33170:138-1775(-)
MGALCSGGTKKSIIPDLVSGDEEDYRSLFIEGPVVGAGEFGQVRHVNLMNDMGNGEDGNPIPYASKVLKKGITFRDNTIYTPLSPTVLYSECKILRVLAGKRHCLRLHSLFESPRSIWIVTEMCSGGDMFDWLSKQGGMLETQHVSRVIFQLLDAVDHCHTNGIIHRDIKPENIMFRSSDIGSAIKLIDFGSGTIDAEEARRCADGVGVEELDKITTPDDMMHHTFAGSAFYISPEMFQRTYTTKTDIWSVGVTSYVLVAGYPADTLQKCFNTLHLNKGRDLRKLPNLPSDLPDEFFNMLDDMLCYRHRQRKSASALLQNEFVQFQSEMDNSFPLAEISMAVDASRREASNSGKKGTLIKNMSLDMSVRRHSLYMDYKKFEKSVASILATMLPGPVFEQLIVKLKTKSEEKETTDVGLRLLQALTIRKVKEVLKEMNNTECIDLIEKLPNALSYEQFAFRISLLKLFSRLEDPEEASMGLDDSVRHSMEAAARKKKLGIRRSNSEERLVGINDPLDRSGRGEKQHNSVHGTDVWEAWKSSRSKIK